MDLQLTGLTVVADIPPSFSSFRGSVLTLDSEGREGRKEEDRRLGWLVVQSLQWMRDGKDFG